MKKHVLILLLGAFLLASCNSSKEILYFQDVPVNEPEMIESAKDITVEPLDQISIVVNSREPELAEMFNLSRPQGSSVGGSNMLGYTVDSQGNIDFPVLGIIHVSGLTKMQIMSLVKRRLMEEDLIKDPVVTVEFMNLSFSVLGEVGSPGRYSIEKDQITLLEALSMAGDLTITGKRDGVFVIREEDGERVTHWVDLRSKDLFGSPVYHLKQNDVVYVQPNKKRSGESTINDNSMKSVSMWMSIISFLTSLSVLLFK